MGVFFMASLLGRHEFGCTAHANRRHLDAVQRLAFAVHASTALRAPRSAGAQRQIALRATLSRDSTA
jgi:hypothetical protein